MRGAVAVGIVMTIAATAAADAGVAAVHTDTGEARACLPLAGGGALVGTGGGLIRVGADGAIAGTWTASDGLPGTRIDAIAELADALWIGTDPGAAEISLTDAGVAITRAFPGRRSVRALARIGATI